MTPPIPLLEKSMMKFECHTPTERKLLTMPNLLLSLLVCVMVNGSAPALADLGQERTLLQHGYAQMVAGKPAEAVQTLSQAVRLNPGSMSARRYLAAAMLQDGQPQQAVVQIKLVVQSPEALLTDSNLLGQAYLKTGHYDQAISAFYTVLKEEPVNSAAHEGLIDCYIASGKQEIARTICSHGLQVAPTATLKRHFQDRLDNMTTPAIAPVNDNNQLAERPNS